MCQVNRHGLDSRAYIKHWELLLRGSFYPRTLALGGENILRVFSPLGGSYYPGGGAFILGH